MKFITLLSVVLVSCTYQHVRNYTYEVPRLGTGTDIAYQAAAQVVVDHGPGQAVGAGFAVRNAENDTFVVSVEHLCEEVGRKALIYSAPLQDAPRTEYKARVVYTNSDDDICILRVFDTGEQFVPLRLSETAPMTGDRVHTIGSPAGAFPTKTEGYVVGHDLLGMEPDEEGVPKSLLLTSVSAYSGNSGGPVYNEQREVVGMLAATHMEYPHSSISVHVESIAYHLELYFGEDNSDDSENEKQ